MSEQKSEAGQPEKRPPMFYPGTFDSGDGGLRLLATRCRACGRTFYPRVALCLDCLATELDELRLDGAGLLECFTTVQMPAARIAPPYTVGYVRLPERLRVFAPIEPSGQSLRVGMPMRLAEYRLGSGANAALAYCYVPA